jgi:hypothetical protein
MEFLLLHDRFQIRGVKILGNMEGVGMAHFKMIERKAIRLWGKTIGKALPIRMKKMVIINVRIVER